MAIQDRLFSLAVKVVKVISLKNIAIWSFAALVGIVGYTVFENRTAIVSYIVNGPESEAPQASTFVVSEVSKSRIKQLVDQDPLVNSIIVLNADIRNNRRIPLFWYADDPSLQRSIDSLFAKRYGGIPLFTGDEKNNENVVGIINGEFACGAYTDGGSAALYPGLSASLPYICRTSLPPYYGQFSGYVTVSLNRVPLPDELVNIKTETLNISTEIYFRDVLPANKKLNPTTPNTP